MQRLASFAALTVAAGASIATERVASGAVGRRITSRVQAPVRPLRVRPGRHSAGAGGSRIAACCAGLGRRATSTSTLSPTPLWPKTVSTGAR